jgi:hypothetical protein
MRTHFPRCIPIAFRPAYPSNDLSVVGQEIRDAAQQSKQPDVTGLLHKPGPGEGTRAAAIIDLARGASCATEALCLLQADPLDLQWDQPITDH